MNIMEILGVIRWVAMGFFVVFFYLYEIKKKEAFTIPAHVAILIAIIFHAIVRDWYLIVRIVIIVVAVIALGGNILKFIRDKKETVT